MAYAAHIVHLSTGTPRLGIWCDGCLTSARYEIDVYVLSAESIGPPISVIRRCRRCDDGGE